MVNSVDIPWDQLHVEFYLVASTINLCNHSLASSGELADLDIKPNNSWKKTDNFSESQNQGKRLQSLPRTPSAFCWSFDHYGTCRSKIGHTNMHALNARESTLLPFVNQTYRVGTKLPTPVNLEILSKLLRGYLENNHVLAGFQNGFSLKFKGPQITSEYKNHQSVLKNPDIVSNMLNKELKKGRIAGPFSSPPFPNFRVSPLGLVPKNEAGKYRIIHNISYPDECTINDFIDRADSAVSYETLDTIISLIQKVGINALIAKADIEEAFRLIPIHPDDYNLLGFIRDGSYFYDKCLPMGCSTSCSIFESVSMALQWILNNKLGVDNLSHILDDFMFIEQGSSTKCQEDLNYFITLCEF